jgi:hypothetical protein
MDHAMSLWPPMLDGSRAAFDHLGISGDGGGIFAHGKESFSLLDEVAGQFGPNVIAEADEQAEKGDEEH